jgi:hypothetical protein
LRVHPDIAALRSDRAPQRLAQTAMQAAIEGWRAEPGVAPVLADFVRFGAGAALEACPALDEVFTQGGRAEALMAALTRRFCAAIKANPLGHPPFRNAFDGRASTMLLGKSGRAQLVLQAREPGTLRTTSAKFTDVLRYDAVLAGQAQGRILRIHGPNEQVGFTEETIALAGGVRVGFDCNREALLAERVETRLVTLRLLQIGANPAPGREYCRQTGALLHQSAGTLASSRREMMAALLGRMERTDAAPVLADMALADGEPATRWQALRECLALDTAEGFAALCRIARNDGDTLAHPAGALRAQLLETHPQLAQLEAAPCPA